MKTNVAIVEYAGYVCSCCGKRLDKGLKLQECDLKGCYEKFENLTEIVCIDDGLEYVHVHKKCHEAFMKLENK